MRSNNCRPQVRQAAVLAAVLALLAAPLSAQTKATAPKYVVVQLGSLEKVMKNKFFTVLVIAPLLALASTGDSKIQSAKGRTLMNRNVIYARLLMITLVALLVSLSPATVAAKCSNATVAGSWGLTLTGSLLLPTGPVLGAAVGTLTAASTGNVTGAEARNVGGAFANETLVGSWTVNPDCTGVLTGNIYESGVLIRTSVLSLVFDQNSTEIRMVQQSLTLPSGTAIPVVITVQGRKMISNGGDEQ